MVRFRSSAVALAGLVALAFSASCGSGVVHSNPDGAVDGGMDAWTGEDGGPDARADSAVDAAAPICGNGVIEGLEACDEGSDNSDTVPDACRGDCTLPRCGDGVRDVLGAEACDDGNTDDGDGCSASCRFYEVEHNLGISAVAYDITKDNNGVVHMVWKVGASLRYGQIDNGLVINAEDIPNSGGVNARYNRPRLAVRPDGATVHLSWNAAPGGTLYHAWRDAAGVWHREVVWDRGATLYYVACSSTAVDLTGAVHIIAQRWEEGSTDPTPVVYWRKPNGGVWSNLVSVQPVASPNNRQWRDTSMFTDEAGGVHAVWKDGARPGKYRYTVSGGNLGTAPTVDIPVPPDPLINSVSFGDLFVTPNGDVHHTFLTYNLQQIWYEVKRSGSSTFGEPSLVGPMNNDETTGYENPWPVMAVDSHNRIFTSWAENRGGSTVPHVVLGYSGASGWTTLDVTNTASINLSSAPAMTAVGDLVYLVYRDASGELRLVNYRLSPP